MSIQLAELHYTTAPSYTAEAIAERAESLVESGIELSDSDDQRETLLFFHTRYPIEYTEGALPAQTAILPTDQPPDVANYAGPIQQSWSCADAEDRLRACATSLGVTEMMARLLAPADRIKLFHGVLQAFVELTNPHAIVFTHSQQVVAPDAYLASCEDEPIRRPGALNVRFFRIADSESDDMIMDTRGLEEIGLHDLQCHYRQLDPNEVSRVLFNTALYIFENGPVIESGNTVAGVDEDAKWICQFEDSLLEPKREVLDLDPGAPFAAGNRS